MAEAVVSLAVETLSTLLIEEGKFLHGVKDQATQLQAKLKLLQGFLKDADKKQNEEERVRECVSQARDLAYQAEDLLEHYAFKLQSRKGRGITSIIKRFTCLLDECLTVHQVGSGIKSLKASISELTTDFERFGVITTMEKEASSSSYEQQQLRRTYSHTAEKEYLVGVESQVKMLVEKLIGNNYKVVSIWGMGGLGKSTLARQVYHHQSVRRSFEAFSWIRVSQQWQVTDLLRKVISKFMPEKMASIYKEWDDDKVARELREFQQNRNCLLVLDNVWSKDAWECIKPVFQIGEKGSKILLTTRNRGIATDIDASGFLHQPPFLNEEESWELLQRKSLIQSRIRDDEFNKMVKLGQVMAKHCNGLPLAVLVLGGILATKGSLMEWEKVNKNVKTHLGKEGIFSEDPGRLESKLALSYNDLPYQLKPCFLYLSKYKEDVDIDTESLYQIWMAEGLIHKDGQLEEETLMDVAERYLEELSHRCMVFVEREEVTLIKRFKSCRLHDFMRDFCLRKAKEENFLDQLTSVSSTSRRLVFHWDKRDERFVRPGKKVAQHLRSFTFSTDGRDVEGFSIGREMIFLIRDFKMLEFYLLKDCGLLMIVVILKHVALCLKVGVLSEH